MTTLISNKLTLIIIIFTIIIVLVVSIILLNVFNHGHPLMTKYTVTNTSSGQSRATTNISIVGENHTYRLAVEELKKILEEARDAYLNALRKNEAWTIFISEPYSNFSKTFILNTTIVNETILLIDHTAYNYIIIHIYNAESKIDFMPQRIKVNNIFIELLPRNNSITYTGIIPYNYLVKYRCKTYRVSFSSIGFIETSYHLTVSTDKIDDNIYKVKITVTKKLGNTAYVSVAWLILVKN